MGMLIVIPSGILCNAIDMASDIPNLVFFVVDIKVIIPSGILCNIIAIHDIMPSLWRKFIFSIFAIDLSIWVVISIPSIMKVIDMRQQEIFGICCFSKEIDSGKRSVMDTDNITPAAKAKLAMIIFSSFFNENRMGIIPNKVDKPANVVIMNDKVILFILSPFKYMFVSGILAILFDFSIIFISNLGDDLNGYYACI